MAYCDTTFADEYLLAGAFADGWSGENRGKYLESATRMIKQFCNFRDDDGFFVYDEEVLPEIPVWLKEATCEQALYLLNLGKDPTQADKKTTIGVQSTEGTVFNKDFRADILAPACAYILEAHGGIISDGARSVSGVSWSFVDK